MWARGIVSILTLAVIGCDQSAPQPPVVEPVQPVVMEPEPVAVTEPHPPAIEIFQDGYEVSTPITELGSDHTHAILA